MVYGKPLGIVVRCPLAGRLGVAVAAWMIASLAGAPCLADGVVINEIHYHPPEGGILEFVELINDTPAAVDVSGWRFDRGLDYTLPAGTSIAPGGFLVIAKEPTELALAFDMPQELVVGGFASSLSNGGETLQLLDDSGVIRDKVRFHDLNPWPLDADGRGGSLERLCPSGSSMSAYNWRSDPAAGPTPGETNNATICPPPAYVAPSVVINEIFYHPLDDSDAESEYIEIRNTTDGVIDISGWTFSDGITYEFETGTELPPQGVLVVARNAEAVRTQHDIENVVGNFEGTLANGGERLALSDASGLEVDIVRYSDRDEWPPQADALGRSLEKVDPLADGNDPLNWRASGTVARDVPFREIVAEGAATSSTMYLYFSGEAEGLIDDLSIAPVADPAANAVPSGDFNVEPTDWEYRGSHSDSRWQPTGGVDNSGCLRLVSTGVGSSSNSARTIAVPELVEGEVYRARFLFKPLNGNVPLTFRLASSTASRGIFVRLIPALISPGDENTVFSTRVPPLVTRVAHGPRMPTSNDDVAVTAHVRGAAELTKVSISVHTGGDVAVVEMFDDGAHGDGFAADGIYGVTMPRQPHNALVRYRVHAEDETGMTARFPTDGDPSDEFAYYVYDNPPDSPLPVYHLLADGINGIGCTSYRSGHFIHEGEVYLNIGVRNRGQSTCGQRKRNLKLRFNRGRYFRGTRKINLNSLWPDKSLLREKLQWDLWRDSNQPYCETFHVRVHNNGEYWGLFIHLENPDKFYLDRNDLNEDGNLYKAVASTEQRQTLAGYRASYEKKTNEDDDFSDLQQFVDELNLTSGAAILEWLHRNVELERMLDYQAVPVVCSNVDHGHKNHYLYHDLEKDTWMPLIWDVDLSYGVTWVQNNGGVENDEIRTIQHSEWAWVGSNSLLTRFFQARSPQTPSTTPRGYFDRAYFARIWAMLKEKYNETVTDAQVFELMDYLMDEANEDEAKWGRFPSRVGPGQPPQPPDFEFNALQILDTGRAAGRGYLRPRLVFLKQRLVANRFLGFPWVRITELNYNPLGPSENLEFVELHNTEDEAVDISGWYIDTIDFEFPPDTTLAAGETVVVSKNPTTFGLFYGETARVFGPYPGNLDNDGDAVRLLEFKPTDVPPYPAFHPITIDFVEYDDELPWPSLADGSGATLELLDLDRDNDYGWNWRDSMEMGGTPGSLGAIEAPSFRRGDVDSSGTLEIGDVLKTLAFLFQRAERPVCFDAADFNDDGKLDVSDPVRGLLWLFASGEPPPAPGPTACGADETPDQLPRCEAAPCP